MIRKLIERGFVVVGERLLTSNEGDDHGER